MHITVLGGTGYAGAHIVTALHAAGHHVTAISRSEPGIRTPGVEYVTGSALDPATIDAAVQHSEVVISALSPRGDMAGRTRDAIAGLARACATAGVRLGVIGGAGSLLTAPNGPKVMNSPHFPDAIKPEAIEMDLVLTDLLSIEPGLDWFYLSPARVFGAWAPGEATGRYRLGDDVLLVDDAGESRLSGADLGTAVADEIDRPAHRRTRFTVAS